MEMRRDGRKRTERGVGGSGKGWRGTSIWGGKLGHGVGTGRMGARRGRRKDGFQFNT